MSILAALPSRAAGPRPPWIDDPIDAEPPLAEQIGAGLAPGCVLVCCEVALQQGGGGGPRQAGRFVLNATLKKGGRIASTMSARLVAALVVIFEVFHAA